LYGELCREARPGRLGAKRDPQKRLNRTTDEPATQGGRFMQPNISSDIKPLAVDPKLTAN
jgi:hypothetical protein